MSIRERRVSENPAAGIVAGYRCTAKDENGRLVIAYFGHTRADEYRHAEFVEKHRSNNNNKPYRTPALKAKARAAAEKIAGRYVSAIGKLYHTAGAGVTT